MAGGTNVASAGAGAARVGSTTAGQGSDLALVR